MEINYVAVVAAGIAGWLVGAAWYGVLGKQWMAALGWDKSRMTDASGKRRIPVTPMIIAFVALMVMAYMLAGVMGHIGPPTIYRGILAGALSWLGFTITAIAVNNAFQMQKPMLTIIDGGHWLLVLVVQGAVLGLIA